LLVANLLAQSDPAQGRSSLAYTVAVGERDNAQPAMGRVRSEVEE